MYFRKLSRINEEAFICAREKNKETEAECRSGLSALTKAVKVDQSAYTLTCFLSFVLCSNFTRPSISAKRVLSVPIPTFLPG